MLIYFLPGLIPIALILRFFVKSISGAPWLDENDQIMKDQDVKDRDILYNQDSIYH